MKDITISEFNRMCPASQLELLKTMEIQMIRSDQERLIFKKNKKVTTSEKIGH